MKYTIVIIITLLSVACAVKKESMVKNEVIEFDYPYDIKEEEKANFVKQITKGKALYKITCAKCHNIKVDDKMVIPDFSLPQLMDYEMRIQYPSHRETLTQSNVSVEELDWIVDFLRYKKKSGVPFP